MIKDMKPPSYQWIEDISRDPDGAMRRIYKEERGYCISWLKKNTSLDQSVCVEIFQNAAIVLYDNVMSKKLTTATSKLSTYLISICRNMSLEYHRKRKKMSSEEEIPELMFFIQDEEGYEEKKMRLIKRISEILIDMGDPCRKLLELYYYDRMSMSDIALNMNYSSSKTAKNQKYKCVERLRKRSSDIKV